MSNVVLSDELLRLYFSFARIGTVKNDESGSNITKLTKLLACIKEFYTNKEQLARCNITEDMLVAVESMPLFNLDNTTTDLQDLVKKSKLKLLIVDKLSGNSEIIEYNILAQKPKYGFHYSMTFKAGEDKLFAKKHIKKLLENAQKIEIIDPYFIKVNKQFSQNIDLLNELVTNKTSKLKIACGASDDNIQIKLELKKAKYSNTDCPPIKANTHDRFIKANGVKIHLSSGFYALTQPSKELTYMVEIL